jgi:hypothetical protein
VIRFALVSLLAVCCSSTSTNAGQTDGCYLSFDGVDGQVLIPDADGALNLRPPFTVEAWFDLAAGESGLTVAKRCVAPLPTAGWALSVGVGDAQVSGTIFARFDHVAAVPVAGTGWRHVAWTLDADAKSTLYFDGAFVSSLAGTLNTEACAEPVLVGLLGVNYESGSIDELRLSSVVRYEGNFEPRHRHEPDAQTLALWHLDEPGSYVAEDASGVHDGQIEGGVKLVCDAVLKTD